MAVYFIKCTETKRYKIGVSTDPEGRLKNLQVGCPSKLELVLVIPGGEKEEKEIHRKFSNHHVRGEWYKGCPAIDIFIRDMGGPYRKQRSIEIFTTDKECQKLYVMAEAIMGGAAFLICSCDGVPVTVFGGEPTIWLSIDTAIEWCENECRDNEEYAVRSPHGVPGTLILEKLIMARQKFLSGEIKVLS